MLTVGAVDISASLPVWLRTNIPVVGIPVPNSIGHSLVVTTRKAELGHPGMVLWRGPLGVATRREHKRQPPA